jgi:hypothetical protein
MLSMLASLGPATPVTAREPVPSGPRLAGVPTSPAGGPQAAPATLPERFMQRARTFRGNPVALGVLTGAILAVALGLGLYTLHVAYRRPGQTP